MNRQGSFFSTEETHITYFRFGPFVPSAPLLYPLKTSRKGVLGANGFIHNSLEPKTKKK